MTLDGVNYQKGGSVTATAVAFRVTVGDHTSILCDFLYGATTQCSNDTDDDLIKSYDQKRIDSIFKTHSGPCYSVTLKDYEADKDEKIYFKPKGQTILAQANQSSQGVLGLL